MPEMHSTLLVTVLNELNGLKPLARTTGTILTLKMVFWDWDSFKLLEQSSKHYFTSSVDYALSPINAEEEIRAIKNIKTPQLETLKMN